MVVSRPGVAGAVGVFAVFLLYGLMCSAEAQGIQQTPYSAANEVRQVGPFGGSAPPNPLGMPGSAYSGPAGSDTIPLSSGMLGPLLPRISNLELGFLYDFGRKISSGRFTADWGIPVSLGTDAVLFGEAHGEFQGFWKRPSGGSQSRTDLSFGGGYRRMFGDNLLVGANGFYDLSCLFSTWYSSGGLGLEMAAKVGGDDAVDVSFNWYGSLFGGNGFINAFRNLGGSYDVQAGYSHALFDHTFDLRLKVTAYQFDVGQKARGWRGGADLTTRDGMFTVRYEHGQDPINGSYSTVGGFVNVGLQLENVLKGESPFTMPQPVFRSPRNIRRWLTRKVKRNWHQPASVIAARSSGSALRVLESRTVVSGPLTPGGGNFLPFAPSVPFGSIATASQVVMTFQNAPPAPNGGVCAIFATAGNTSSVNILPGQTEVIVTSTDWTHGAGLTGPFVILLIHNLVGNPNWEPGTITVQWQG